MSHPPRKSCPFCGSVDLGVHSKPGVLTATYRVVCMMCNAQGPEILRTSGAAEAREQCIAKWDERTAS